MFNTYLSITLICVVCTDEVQSARILGIFPLASPSHYILGNALMRGLAEAGHNVTMISPYEEKILPKKGSYRDIILTGFVDDYNDMLKIMNFFDNKPQSIFDFKKKTLNYINKMNDKFFEHESVRSLINSNKKFDVVIGQQFLNDAMKIFGTIFNAPVITFSTLAVNPWVNKMVGNPSPLSYIPQMGTNFPPYMSFFQRLTNVFLSIFSNYMEYFHYFPQQNKILQKHFTNPPDIYELYHNVSLVLLNSHESLNQAVPYVPNMIQIGGFHVKPPKKLPKDLQEYLDNAKEGVIYFSMGSNLRSKDLSVNKRYALLKAFEKRREKVLWKWEDDDLPGKPPNVRTEKWLPQQDILAHPNVRLFITHSGLLSTIETVYHGVPILGIPVFGDQHTNAEIAKMGGYALALLYADPSFSEDKLSELLNELLTNPQYKNNVKKRSKLFHDRPQKPLDVAIYWVEYVIRNGGAPHLKVAGVDLPWYIYHSLDVISFLVVATFLLLIILYFTIKIFLICICWRICIQKQYSKFKKE